MKAYLVLDLSVNDLGCFRKYIAEIPAFIAKHSGKYIVQGVQPTTIEGDWKPERMVIIEFPQREKAEAFLSDPEIQDLFKVRHDTTTSKLVLACGCTQLPPFRVRYGDELSYTPPKGRKPYHPFPDRPLLSLRVFQPPHCAPA